jgi:AcrR family transcriptional regulator
VSAAGRHLLADEAEPAAPADKRRTILDAATRLFAERGFDGVSMRDIAAASGFRLGSLYHFFPEKGVLYEKAVTGAFERCNQHLMRALAEPGPAPQRLRRLTETIYTLFKSSEPDIRLIDREHLPGASGQVAELARDAFLQIHAALHPIVAELSGRPGLSDRDIDWTTSHIFALTYGAAKLHVQHEPLLGLNSEAVRKAFLDDLGALILRAI